AHRAPPGRADAVAGVNDPYAPPATLEPSAATQGAPGAPRVRYAARVVGWSLAFGAAYGALAGAAEYLRFSLAMRRYGAWDYAAGVLGLSATRGWGAWGASLAPACAAVVLLHRAGKRADGRPTVDHRHWPLVGVAVPALYPVVVAAGWFVALPLWCADSGGAAGDFVRGLAGFVEPVDIAYGAAFCATTGLSVAVSVRFLAHLLVGRGWLVAKLFAAWVGLQAI